MLIEFIGLPGSGKTTTAKSFLSEREIVSQYASEEMTKRASTLLGKWYTVIDTMIYFFKSPVSFLMLLAAVLLSPARKCNFRSFLKIAVQDSLSTRKTTTSMLADQWLVQELWGLYVNTSNKQLIYSAIKRILSRHVKRDILFVFIEIDHDVTSGRIAARFGGASRYDNIGSKRNISQMMEKDASILYEILDYCEAEGAVILRINGLLSTAEIVSQVRTALSIKDRLSSKCT